MANYEEIYLNGLRKNQEPVAIKDISGTTYKGIVTAFDPVCIILDLCNEKRQILLRKENLISLTPIRLSVRYIFMEAPEDRAKGDQI